MTISTLEIDRKTLAVASVSFDAYYFHFHLNDGRILTTPLWWYPRLHKATFKERSNWRVLPMGYGVEWEDVDEHISAFGLIMGEPAPGAVMPMLDVAE